MGLLTRRLLFYQCQRLSSTTQSKATAPNKELKAVIGLEVHAQLATRSKMFSDAPVLSHAASNTNVSLFDLGTPGTLPTLNRKCVELAIRTAILLNCEIAKECRFDRKHYFYPDMPMGFQITQHELPIAKNGYFDYVTKVADNFRDETKRNAYYEYLSKGNNEVQEANKRRVRIKQLQMEMDSGKVIYGVDRNLIDLNRAGVGLIEIVTEPDFTSPLEATSFIENLRLMLVHNQICLGEMHNGHLRVDANVSISIDGQMGVRSETKNINSLNDIRKCLEFEVKRQTDLINKGEILQPETRGPSNGRTILLRVKGNDMDYRFLPEPNLPRLHVKDEWIEKERKEVKLDAPHLNYIFEHKLPVNFSFKLASDPKVLAFMEKCKKHLESPLKDIVHLLYELESVFHSVNALYPPESDHIVEPCCKLMDLARQRKITHLAYLDLIRFYASQKGTTDFVGVDEKIAELNFWAINDEAEIMKIVDEVFKDASPELLGHARDKLHGKQFNKLRNLVVNLVYKRIHIDDAEKYVLQKLFAKN